MLQSHWSSALNGVRQQQRSLNTLSGSTLPPKWWQWGAGGSAPPTPTGAAPFAALPAPPSSNRGAMHCAALMSSIRLLGGRTRPADDAVFTRLQHSPPRPASPMRCGGGSSTTAASAAAAMCSSTASHAGILARPRDWIAGVLQGCWPRQAHWWGRGAGACWLAWAQGGSAGWGGGGSGGGLALPFAVDTCEDEGAYFIFGDLPGVARADIEVTTSGQQITIEAWRGRPTANRSSSPTRPTNAAANSTVAATTTSGDSQGSSDATPSSDTASGHPGPLSAGTVTGTNEVIGSVLSATTDGPSADTDTSAATLPHLPHPTTVATSTSTTVADSAGVGTPRHGRRAHTDPSPPPPPPPSPLKPRRRERTFGRLCRRLIFPHDADLATSSAVLRDGVLCVTIPKRRGDDTRQPVPIEG